MDFDHFNTEPKLLVSDSLQDVLSEEQLQGIDDMFITVALVDDSNSLVLSGHLVGIEFLPQPKIDIKVSLRDAFNFVSNILIHEKRRKASSMVLMLGSDAVNIPGPFSISNSKIIEIDPTNKLCIVAIDLISDT